MRHNQIAITVAAAIRPRTPNEPLHAPRNLRNIPDRIVDVGLAHRDGVHFAAMRAVYVERHGPGVAEAFHVGQDAGVGLLPGLGTDKEEWAWWAPRVETGGSAIGLSVTGAGN